MHSRVMFNDMYLLNCRNKWQLKKIENQSSFYLHLKKDSILHTTHQYIAETLLRLSFNTNQSIKPIVPNTKIWTQSVDSMDTLEDLSCINWTFSYHKPNIIAYKLLKKKIFFSFSHCGLLNFGPPEPISWCISNFQSWPYILQL